jgi:C_GCAxxG_C_C family probable redox protein
MSPQAREIVERVSQKAENLFSTKQLLCTESILVSFNEVFDGGLSRQQAVGLSAGLSTGLGDSGCLCGAVSGGSLALGLILPGCNTGGNRKKLRKATAKLHDRFKQEFGSTCCRVLSRKVKNDSKAHFAQCSGITQSAARMTAELLLEMRPELADQPLVSKRPCLDNVPCGRLRWLVNWLCG